VIRGTQGYAEQSDELIGRYDAIDFADKHRVVLHLVPAVPSHVLDIGAGTGADAAWLANRGHRVVAVEPTTTFRLHGMARYPSLPIEWVEDFLPGLENVVRIRREFDFILLSAVWMHLDEDERRIAMPVVASLLAPGGVLIVMLRHGPVPSGRVMFEVSPEETIAIAKGCNLETVVDRRTASVQAINRDAAVTWSHLAFKRP
jgi:SAM-dependent methyltransferase